jgi:2-polyprenyl-3-methyl-5-hydroxy-6-metoxy-1,4-benzoquinol methylase
MNTLFGSPPKGNSTDRIGGAHMGHADAGYYALSRDELLELHFWRGGEYVLDVGCGAGANHQFLRARGAQSITGIEMAIEPARQASTVYDHVLVGRVEDVLAELPTKPDVIICADILEHLAEPASIVERLAELTDPSATLLVSVPNVRHVSVLRMLVLSGEWTYQPSGIMDGTHLRWFTSQSIIELLSSCGWRTVDIRPKFNTRRQLAWNAVTRGTMAAFLAEQYLIRAVKCS